ncbi:MAG: response regulator transcription factor [Chloroflexota bacterium]
MADEEKIRVIIVDDIAETRENIRKLLQFEPDVEVVGVANTGAEGIAVTIELEPDVVLMDINMPDMDGISATEKIRSRLPSTQIVILSIQTDLSYMRRAMIAGAHDFLSKPPDVDELAAAIRRAGEKLGKKRQNSRQQWPLYKQAVQQQVGYFFLLCIKGKLFLYIVQRVEPAQQRLPRI